MYTFEGKKR